MKTFSVATTIHATPEAVWQLLTDAPGFPAWDPEVTSIDGRIAPGEKITLHSKSEPKVFSVKVTEFEPLRRMVWTGGGMPEAIFKGDRIFTLTPHDGAVDFSMQLVFSGLMAPVITKAVPDVQPIFNDFAAALKRRAEQE